jgi:GNAT superfamily N-acetyltransferase
MEIRPLRCADADQWRPLWRAYLAFYETELSEEIHRTTFDRLTDASVTDYHGLIAVEDGIGAGLAHFIYHRHGWQIADACYLQDLFVAPQQRGSGVGRALMEAVYAVADADGKGSVCWLTQASNVQARALYDRIGVVTPFIKYKR